MEKIKSAIKKVKNLNLKGFKEGQKNLKSGEFEDIAKERAAICAKCEFNEVEPIQELAITDSIKSVNKRMCGVCGCSLPLLIRQFEKNCSADKW